MSKSYGNTGNFLLFDEPQTKAIKVLHLSMKATNSIHRLIQTESNKFEVRTNGYYHLDKWTRLNKTEQLMKDLVEIGFMEEGEDLRVSKVYPTNAGTWMHTVVELKFWDGNYKKHRLERSGSLTQVFVE